MSVRRAHAARARIIRVDSQADLVGNVRSLMLSIGRRLRPPCAGRRQLRRPQKGHDLNEAAAATLRNQFN
eukprot:4610222-Prymnesium_polylepis.1